MTPRDEHIECCKAALVRRQAKMDALYSAVDYPGMTEHECALAAIDSPWFDLCKHQDRARKWLIILLRKRGTADDLSLAQAIQWTAWP